MPTKHRDWPNSAIYQRDQTLRGAMKTMRHAIRAQDVLAQASDLSTSVEVLRLINVAMKELGAAIGHSGNIVVHMQNAGAKSDETLHVASTKRD